MRTYGFREDYYREAASKDVKLHPLRAGGQARGGGRRDEDGRSVLRVTVPDPILGQKLALDVDLVVLSAAVVPSAGSQDAARLFKVALNPDGFFQEAHVKLRPVDFAADGVFLCGTAHYPKHLSETISQAYGAAGRAGCSCRRTRSSPPAPVCDVDERRVRLVRGLHHGLQLRRDRLRETPAARRPW